MFTVWMDFNKLAQRVHCDFIRDIFRLNHLFLTLSKIINILCNVIYFTIFVFKGDSKRKYNFRKKISTKKNESRNSMLEHTFFTPIFIFFKNSFCFEPYNSKKFHDLLMRVWHELNLLNLSSCYFWLGMTDKKKEFVQRFWHFKYNFFLSKFAVNYNKNSQLRL